MPIVIAAHNLNENHIGLKYLKVRTTGYIYVILLHTKLDNRSELYQNYIWKYNNNLFHYFNNKKQR